MICNELRMVSIKVFHRRFRFPFIAQIRNEFFLERTIVPQKLVHYDTSNKGYPSKMRYRNVPGYLGTRYERRYDGCNLAANVVNVYRTPSPRRPTFSARATRSSPNSCCTTNPAVASRRRSRRSCACSDTAPPICWYPWRPISCVRGPAPPPPPASKLTVRCNVGVGAISVCYFLRRRLRDSYSTPR